VTIGWPGGFELAVIREREREREALEQAARYRERQIQMALSPVLTDIADLRRTLESDRCRDCRMDDEPLDEGLCRYCAELRELTGDIWMTTEAIGGVSWLAVLMPAVAFAVALCAVLVILAR
jgi:hypothetical protein